MSARAGLTTCSRWSVQHEKSRVHAFKDGRVWFVRVPPGRGICQPMSEFDSIMVRVEIGNSRKLRRLTPEQRWCVVAGVWCLAAKSPVRGYLLITDSVPVEVADVAAQAEVKPAVAKKTLEKMRRLGMLETRSRGEYVVDPDILGVARSPSHADAQRRMRMRRARGHSTDPQIRARIDFYGGLCWICRSAPYEALDHVKPLARGGSNWPANLRPACQSCNSQKGAKWPYTPPGGTS
jgi:hypothetical protein